MPGWAGVLYASYIGFLSPEISDYHVTFEFLIFCMIGGLGTLGGPLIGAFLLTVVSELLHGVAVPRLVAYGFCWSSSSSSFAGGIVGGAQMLWLRVSRKGAEDEPELLEVKGLCKDFGGLRALDEVDFHIREGEIFSIIGPNGSGKTTLFNVITGFHPATTGKVYFRGEDITNLKPFTIAQKGIARTFQLTAVFSRDTVFGQPDGRPPAANQGRPSWERSSAAVRTREEERKCREKAEEILEFIGLVRRRNKMAGNLTQEAQKRLSIGMALATDPKLLLLDEPTGGVNFKEISSLVSLIERIKEKKITVCLIEHKMKVAMELPDRVMVLNYGRKITEGLPARGEPGSEGDRSLPGEELCCLRSENIETYYGSAQALKGISLEVKKGS